MPQMPFDDGIVAKMKSAGAKILRESPALPPRELAGAVFDAMHLARLDSAVGNDLTVASDRTGGFVGNGRTAAMDRAGADVVDTAAGTAAEDLAIKIYEAMSRAGAGLGNG
jgi:hypothetical protein